MRAGDTSVSVEVFSTYLSAFAEPVDGGLRQMLDPMTFGAWEPADVWADLRSLAMPLHIVRGGTSDVLSSDVVNEMRAQLPAARFHEVDGAGNFLMLAKPERLAAIIDEVVLEVEAIGA